MDLHPRLAPDHLRPPQQALKKRAHPWQQTTKR
jgi:hypothetical protein